MILLSDDCSLATHDGLLCGGGLQIYRHDPVVFLRYRAATGFLDTGIPMHPNSRTFFLYLALELAWRELGCFGGCWNSRMSAPTLCLSTYGLLPRAYRDFSSVQPKLADPPCTRRMAAGVLPLVSPPPTPLPPEPSGPPFSCGCLLPERFVGLVFFH